MDVVYLVSPDLHHEHIELRYSIRSLVKHLIGLNRIFIVGHCPAFLKDVIHIPVGDPHKHNAARNIYEKILAACNDERVSEDFFCISDDHILNRRYSIDSFPVYYDEVYHTLPLLNARIGTKNDYKPYVESTIKALEARGFPLVNYNVHTPMIYSKTVFKTFMSDYDWNTRKGYITKSLYANSLRLGAMQFKDCKIKSPKTATALDIIINNAQIFSTNEQSMNEPMKAKLQQMFPDPVKFE